MSVSSSTMGMKCLAVLVAVFLWWQVHGRGMGSVTLDVPLQLQGLPKSMMVINDVPDKVRITVSGLQSRLAAASFEKLVLPLDVSTIHEPGVVKRELTLDSMMLPSGLRLERVRPDQLELQVDHLATRVLPIHADIDLADGWHIEQLKLQPEQVSVSGPEVWLESVGSLTTVQLHLPRIEGPFSLEVHVLAPAGKALRLKKQDQVIRVSGVLVSPMELP